MFGVQPLDGNVHITGSPLYHTAVLMWTANVAADRPFGGAHGQVVGRGRLELTRPTASPRATWCRPCSTGCCSSPPEVRRVLRRLLAAQHGPRRRALPGRDQAPHDRVVGRLDLGVLRGDRGRRHLRQRQGVDALPGHGRQGLAQQRGRSWSTSPARSARRLCRAPSTCAWAATSSSTTRTRHKTAKSRLKDSGFWTVGDVGYFNEDGYLFLNDRTNDMIIVGGVNIYPAEIEGALRPAPSGRRRGRLRHSQRGQRRRDQGGHRAGRRAFEPGDDVRRLHHGLLRDNLARLQAPKSIDFTERDAPRSERQALQAQAARPLLGRPRRPHLTLPGPPNLGRAVPGHRSTEADPRSDG